MLTRINEANLGRQTWKQICSLRWECGVRGARPGLGDEAGSQNRGGWLQYHQINTGNLNGGDETSGWNSILKTRGEEACSLGG